MRGRAGPPRRGPHGLTERVDHDRFPADGVGEGFDTTADVLSLPPLLLEKYFDAAEEVKFDDEFALDAADSDDDELDEDQPTEFVWQGTTYWRTWDGHVMDDPEGAVVGRWDDESESVVFDE